MPSRSPSSPRAPDDGRRRCRGSTNNRGQDRSPSQHSPDSCGCSAAVQESTGQRPREWRGSVARNNVRSSAHASERHARNVWLSGASAHQAVDQKPQPADECGWSSSNTHALVRAQAPGLRRRCAPEPYSRRRRETAAADDCHALLRGRTRLERTVSAVSTCGESLDDFEPLSSTTAGRCERRSWLVQPDLGAVSVQLCKAWHRLQTPS